MRLPTASSWGGRSLPLIHLLVALSAAAVLAGPPVRLLADEKLECFKEGNGVVTFELVEGCKQASAVLVFGHELVFNVSYGRTEEPKSSGTLEIGDCSGEFGLAYVPPKTTIPGAWYNATGGKLPWTGKADEQAIVVDSKPLDCKPTIEETDEDKQKTTVSFNMSQTVPTLVFTFNAALDTSKPPKAEEAGFTGWKLWATVGGGVGLLLLLIGIVVAVVVVVCLRKKRAAKQAGAQTAHKGCVSVVPVGF